MVILREFSAKGDLSILVVLVVDHQLLITQKYLNNYTPYKGTFRLHFSVLLSSPKQVKC